MKSIIKTIGLCLVLVATGYFVYALYAQRAVFAEINWSGGAALAMVGSIVGMLAITLLGGVAWRILLADQGFKLPWPTAIRLVALSQIGKYLPGNVGHFVGQVALSRAVGIPVGVSVAALGISTVWLIALGVGVGSAGLIEAAATSGVSWMPAFTPGRLIPLFVLLIALPWIGIFVLNHFLPTLSEALGKGQKIMPPSLGAAILLTSLFLGTFIIFGLMLKAQSSALFDTPDVGVITFTLLFASAWVAGYLIPGAPGGVGIREAMMLLLFTPLLGAGPAAAIGLSMRVATTLGDGAAFLAGLTIGWAQKNKEINYESQS
ncbi:lysylphosphatidylglycerol synthase domain-containing protein [Spiribacter salilacus]|nr:lysylphosphatidylglycerol synthase domain-containing protein [Spiribacter salilacus]